MADRYPRGSGGCILHPGSIVLIHGLSKAKDMNGQEGECEAWDPDEGRMHVRVGGPVGPVKGLKPQNLRKVMVAQKKDPHEEAILAEFRNHDENGDGILDRRELLHVMELLKVPARALEVFLNDMDKDGDGEISYEEFVAWALRRDSAAEENRKAKTPMPRGRKGVSVQNVEDDDDDLMQHKVITIEDLLRIHTVPDDWPKHAMAILNNMHARFPNYEMEKIISAMAKHKYIGGNVMKAIRDTGAREVEVANFTTDISSAARGANGQPLFPAKYRVRSCEHQVPIYAETTRGWSFALLRDEKLVADGKFEDGETFTVKEVRIGSAYGYCFGKVEWSNRYGKEPDYWVNLGLSMREWNFTAAERLTST